VTRGFYTATICATCDPPVVAISTGHGSRCPRCGYVDEGGGPSSLGLSDGAFARDVLRETALRSDASARTLVALANRLLDRVGRESATIEGFHK
jgi:hypothetical protein